jgi:hypothetical protein
VAQPLLAARVRLAESVDEWFQRNRNLAFSDLLELENHLAHLAAVTILFVESEGAIAELGAFAASTELCPKTLAVLNERFAEDRSFIAHGPLLRIRNRNKGHVRVYPWDFNDLNSDTAQETLAGLSSDIADAIELQDQQRPKQVLLKDTVGHRLLLIADLIRIAGVAEDSTISDCLRALDYNDTPEDLLRYLSILHSAGLIAKRQRGDATFYERRAPEHFVRYVFKDGANETDAKRIQVLVRESLGKHEKGIVKDSLRKAAPNV